MSHVTPLNDPAVPRLNPPRITRLTRRIAPIVVFLGSAASFGYDLAAEPHFADEAAYYSQSYYWDTFIQGDWNSNDWIDYPAYDLPPLPKFAIGAALSLNARPRPTPADAHRWYFDYTRCDPPGALVVARAPIVLLGALGCVAIFTLGLLFLDHRLGLLAALFLAANPLYRLHARRAMSDVPSETFLLLALAAFLWAWTRVLGPQPRSTLRVALVAALAGLCCGLSLLSKLSGLLSLFVIAAWSLLPCLFPTPLRNRTLLPLALIAAVTASAAFLALNPFPTTRPTRSIPPAARPILAMNPMERVRMMFSLRPSVAAVQQRNFPHNALHTPLQKIAVVACQGFGRFGPLGPRHSDSRIRYDLHQDFGAFLWLPLVALGAVLAFRLGLRQSRAALPPTAWALLVEFAVVLTVVTAYIPMAWDRYQLAIQAPCSLLAALAVLVLFDSLFQRSRPPLPLA